MPTPADYDDGTDPVIPSTPSPFLPGSVPSGDTYLRNSNIDRIMPYVGRPLSQVPSATPAAFRTVPPPQTTPASFSFDDPAFGGRGNQVAAVPRPPREERSPGIHPVPEGVLTPPLTSPNNPWFMNTPRGEPAQTPFQPQINRYSNEYGLPPALFNALIHAESGYKPGAVSSTGAIGLGQLEPGTAREMGVRNLYDPDQNLQGAARYLRQMYDRYGSWSKAVSAYNRGPGGAEKTGFSLAGYQGYGPGRALIATAAALDGGLVKAGPLVPPPQNYRPESYGPNRWTPDRPPSQWGRDTPDMFSGIGAIPHQREIPGIMKALAPLLMVGLSIFSKGAALPMLSFYGGYLKASAAKQDKDAKELKTKYQDQLKELKAKMGIELAAYGGAGGDMSELRNLAVEFGDQTLLGILDAGKDPGPLLQQRDRIFKDTSKTDLAERREELAELREERAQRREERDHELDPLKKQDLENRIKKADEEIKKKEADARHLQEEAKKWGGGSTTAPAEDAEKPEEEPPPSESTPAPQEPEPAPPAPSDSDAPGTGGAATPPAGATPASAEAAPTSEPPPTGGEDQVVDAQGNPIRPRADVVPADYRGPTPQATPAADTSGGAQPTPSPLDTKAAGMVMGDTNLTGIEKAQQDEIQYRAAKMQDALNRIPKNLTGEAVTDAVSRINPQMGDALGNLLNYTSGVPGEGATSGGQGGRMNPFWQRMEALAHQANPYWNPGQFHMYQKQREDFAGGGKNAITLTRSNRLLSASAKVLQAAQEIEKIQGFDANRLQAEIARFNATGIVGDPEYAGLESAWRNFAIESTAVSQGAIPPVTTTKALMDVAPMGGTVRTIRNAVKTDLYSAIGAVETARQVWNQLPENQGRHSEPLGFIQQAYDGLNIIGNTLDLQTGAMSPTYTDENGEQHTVKMPAMLQAAQPSSAPPAGGGGGGAQAPVMDQKAYDAAPSGTHYRMPDDPPGSYRTKP